MMKNLKRQELPKLCNRIKQPIFGYRMSLKEVLLFAAEGTMILGLFGYFFYRSVLITVLASPLVVFYILYKKNHAAEKYKAEIRMQFKEALTSINGSYRAGYSLENAFLEAINDMQSFYGKNAGIVKELIAVRLGLKNNIPLTNLIEDMGRRTGVSDIREFAAILVIGKQTGGNIGDMIESFIGVMQEKLQATQEIEAMISAKKMEQKIMCCVPFFIIFYIEITSKHFFDVLYNNVVGRLIMTGCLIMYVISIAMSKRISDIRI